MSSEYCLRCGAPLTYLEEDMVLCTDCEDAIIDEEDDEDECETLSDS